MTRRLLLGLLVAVCAVSVAACGGRSTAGQGATGIAPADAVAYVSVDTDLEGDQIEQARRLLDRFPGSSGLLGMLEAKLESAGDVDFQRDVRPALGDRLELVVLDVPRDGGPAPVVALLQPNDEAAFDALLEKASAENRPVVTEIEGWTVIADDQATLDRFEQAREAGTLEESDDFRNAMDGLDENALVRAYVSPRAFKQVASAGQAGVPQLDQLYSPNGVGFTVSAEERGLSFRVASTTGVETESFQPELPAVLPAGAIAYAGIGNVADAIRDALNRAGEENPEVDRQIAQLELALGLSLDEDVLPLLERETAIVVYPGEAGSELPALLVAMRVEDEQRAVTTVDRILERAGQFMTELPQPTTTEIEGVEVREVALPDGTTIVYGASDGTLFATSSSELASQLLGDGPRLADDQSFVDAGEQADLPDEVESLFYVNLNEGADYAFQLAEQTGETVPPQVRENVEPLAWLLLHSSREDDRSIGSGFLALDE